ncbi:hypothetical protein MBN60_00090 [Candidatus Saccharibacteria bacterium]|nr:hypothetical protein [Candidatus Saccharibacteria bacterium]
MTNMIKAKIKELQNKAAEISEHFENQSSVYVRSGQDIFEANRENHDDAFIVSRVANEYWWKFEWFLNDSDLWKDSDFDDIEEIAEEFEGRFAGFFSGELKTRLSENVL